MGDDTGPLPSSPLATVMQARGQERAGSWRGTGAPNTAEPWGASLASFEAPEASEPGSLGGSSWGPGEAFGAAWMAAGSKKGGDGGKDCEGTAPRPPARPPLATQTGVLPPPLRHTRSRPHWPRRRGGEGRGASRRGGLRPGGGPGSPLRWAGGGLPTPPLWPSATEPTRLSRPPRPPPARPPASFLCGGVPGGGVGRGGVRPSGPCPAPAPASSPLPPRHSPAQPGAPRAG